jgi:outer membrane protein TolC
VALTGALLALALTMKTLNVFSIFGVIMMLGLVAKNAILIVDRTNELKSEGRNVLYALLDAGKTRLRPILMTTLAMVIGMLPLAMQKGSGGEYNSALAWVLIGGLTSSMIFTLFIVPAIYLELERFLSRFSKKKTTISEKNNFAKTAVTAIVIVFLAIPNVFGQNVLSLQEAENRLKSQNPELAIQKKDLDKATWQIREARSLYLPSLNMSGNYNHNIKPQVFFVPATLADPTGNPNEFVPLKASAKNAYQANLSLSVPLLQFENKPTLDNANLGKQSAELKIKNLENQKVAELRKTYYEALWAKAQIQFWQENLKRQNRILADVRQRLQQGFLTEADTLQAFVQVENLKPNLVKAQNAYKLAEKQLKLLLNFANTETLTLTDSLGLPKTIASTETNLSSRPDLQQMNLQTQFLANQVRTEKARLLPNLQFVGQHSILSQSENFDFGKYRWVNTNFVGFQLNVPIFNGLRQQSKIQQTQIEQKQAEESYQFALKQADLEVQTYADNLQELALQLQTQEKVVQAGQRAYSLVYDRWRQGLAKQGDLIDAENTLQQAKINQIGLIYNYLLLETELKRLQGE